MWSNIQTRRASKIIIVKIIREKLCRALLTEHRPCYAIGCQKVTDTNRFGVPWIYIAVALNLCRLLLHPCECIGSSHTSGAHWSAENTDILASMSFARSCAFLSLSLSHSPARFTNTWNDEAIQRFIQHTHFMWIHETGYRLIDECLFISLNSSVSVVYACAWRMSMCSVCCLLLV